MTKTTNTKPDAAPSEHFVLCARLYMMLADEEPDAALAALDAVRAYIARHPGSLPARLSN